MPNTLVAKIWLPAEVQWQFREERLATMAKENQESYY